ncbi:hypothetical protein HDK90DRAFT_340402 [Phyllosticta capitalensis]|uniref:histidine kinase n=1 Tax=Phyllosticta capitalensis TaxID=121624 RepID=A0ABR1YGF4_9PEZI
MYKMRIPIREQLGLLTLMTCLIGLAVISIATWVTNHSFVLDIRASRLTLTASLKATQLASNLLLMQSLASGVASRIVIQDSLKRYNEASAADRTDFDWANASTDLQAVFDGGTNLLLQAQIWPKTYDGPAPNNSVIHATATAVNGSLPLPLQSANGSSVHLGDSGQGYPFMLYPNLTFSTQKLRDGYDLTVANYEGQSLNNTGSLFLGPWELNSSFSLVSLTTPVINNTSAQDVLGWITVILDGRLIYQVINSTSGMGFTSSTVIVGPKNVTNHFGPGVLYTDNDGNPPETESVRFVIQPYGKYSKSRHSSHAFGQEDATRPFNYSQYPAVKKALTVQDGVENNSGSMVTTKNEDGDTLAVGYALPDTTLCDWVVLVEVSHSEVWQPIVKLRKILLACVFGTTGAMALLIYPIAHYFSRPIRRLRDATRLSTSAYMVDEKSLHPGGFDGPDGSSDIAQKGGFFATLKCWGRGKSREDQDGENDSDKRRQFRIPGKVKEGKHFITDELTELTTVFNEMTDELKIQYEKLEERVKQRTMELEEAMKAAEAANESKTLFIANLSHELKTPLNGILGMTAVSMSEDDPAKIRKSLAIIYRSGDLLLNLLTDLLTFSKNQIGHQQLSLDEKEFRLRDLSTQLLAIFDKQARENNISLSVKFEGPNDLEDLPSDDRSPSPLGIRNVGHMVLWGDQHRIIQVLINLISNSLKFTPPGGSVVCTIRCAGVTTPTIRSRTSRSSVSSHLNRRTSNRSSRFRGRGSVGSTSSGVTPRHNSNFTQINALPEKPLPYAHVAEAQAPPSPPTGPSLLFEFEVTDTGPGVPENMQQRIFEPFIQGDLGLSKKYGGTGLGLSICSQLAALMRGSIKLHSVVGQGSTFTMEIPLRHVGSSAGSSEASSSHVPDTASVSYSRRSSRSMEATTARTLSTGEELTGTRPTCSSHSNVTAPVSFDSNSKPRLVGLRQPFFAVPSPGGSPTAQEEAREHLAAQAAAKDHRIKILVAEDNRTNQEVVLRMLKLEDIYDVAIAKDGQEAFEKVKESMESSNPYDLLLMDIQMPVMDGLQSTRLIREAGYSAPIVALTAYAEENNVKECFDSGMDYFLSKPLRRPALKHVLKTYCPPIVEEVEPASSSPPSSPPRGKAGEPSGSTPPTTEPQSPISPMSPMSPMSGP